MRKLQEEKAELENKMKAYEQRMQEMEVTRLAVHANLLRPATQDLLSAPATPLARSETAERTEMREGLPEGREATPGEAAAEKEKADVIERRKKRHAQWGRFMRSLGG